jgi:hypothetical protein
VAVQPASARASPALPALGVPAAFALVVREDRDRSVVVQPPDDVVADEVLETVRLPAQDAAGFAGVGYVPAVAGYLELLTGLQGPTQSLRASQPSWLADARATACRLGH